MAQNITIERVLELLETYGASPQSWPEEERAAAEILLRDKPLEFEAALAAARALDAMFDEHIGPEPSKDLAAKILAHAPHVQKKRSQRHVLFDLLSVFRKRRAQLSTGAVFGGLAISFVSGYAYAATGLSAAESDYEAAFESAFSTDIESNWGLVETLNE